MNTRFWLVSAASLALLVGCKKDGEGAGGSGGAAGGGATCAQLVDKMAECKPDRFPADKKATIIEKCEKESVKDAAMLAAAGPCVSKSCDEFESCMDAAQEAGRKTKYLADIKEASEKKDYSKISYTCERIVEKKTDAELVKACQDLAKTATTDLKGQLDKLLADKKDDEKFLCGDYKQFAKIVSEEEGKSAETFCSEFSGKVRAGAKSAEITKATEAKDWKTSAIYSCPDTDEEKKKEADLAAACLDFYTKATADLTAGLTKARDELKGDDAFVCLDLKRYAKKVSDDEEKKANTLCDEVDWADDVSKTLAAVKEATAKGEVPFECGYTGEKLDGLGTDWAKAQSAALAKECYVVLGKAVIEKQLPEMKYTCDYQVKKVLEGLDKYKLTDPSLDTVLANENLKKLCNR